MPEPTNTEQPWGGRFDDARDQFEAAARAYGDAAGAAERSPGERVDSMVVPSDADSAPNL